jgi:A/G-specific adenine glycosylase
VPTVFIETNIRTVFIHFFFQKRDKIHDKELMPFVAQTVDRDHPREWYYALMDYGVMLKQQITNPSRKSAHYSRQSKFQGSDRQIRGLIIKILTNTQILSFEGLREQLPCEVDRLTSIINGLIKEGLLRKKGKNLAI